MAATAPLCDFGWQASDFHLVDLEGRTRSLQDVRGLNGLLLMFICNHCPYVIAIIDRLVAATDLLRTQHGIGSVAIMSNDVSRYPEDGVEPMRGFANRHRFGFPYLYDESQAVARAYGAVCTPDFFGFNAGLELHYRGRLDASRTSLVADAAPELMDAMILIASTGRGPDHQIPSIGCSIKWRDGP